MEHFPAQLIKCDQCPQQCRISKVNCRLQYCSVCFVYCKSVQCTFDPLSRCQTCASLCTDCPFIKAKFVDNNQINGRQWCNRSYLPYCGADRQQSKINQQRCCLRWRPVAPILVADRAVYWQARSIPSPVLCLSVSSFQSTILASIVLYCHCTVPIADQAANIS